MISDNRLGPYGVTLEARFIQCPMLCLRSFVTENSPVGSQVAIDVDAQDVNHFDETPPTAGTVNDVMKLRIQLHPFSGIADDGVHTDQDDLHLIQICLSQ